MSVEYQLHDLLRVARRLNNTKRPWLYVNPLQGKHIPASPSEVLHLFQRLADRLTAQYPAERLLIIGFAETATAIGTAVSVLCPSASHTMTTTRENIPGTQYLFFTESHSHATEQRLAVDGLEEALRRVDRVVFVEDEVTTGSTIWKLISVLREAYPGYRGRFAIASLLNSMPEERLAFFREQHIPLHWLLQIPAGYGLDQLEHIPEAEDGEPEHIPEAPETLEPTVSGRGETCWNPRLVSPRQAAAQGMETFVREILDQIPAADHARSILVLGTEEFMLPGIALGKALEDRDPAAEVRFHATTRSPISVFDLPDYPLHRRYSLPSLYDPARQTYLYDLRSYDLVLIATDAVHARDSGGLIALLQALGDCGNPTIYAYQWEKSGHAKQLFPG